MLEIPDMLSKTIPRNFEEKSLFICHLEILLIYETKHAKRNYRSYLFLCIANLFIRKIFKRPNI